MGILFRRARLDDAPRLAPLTEELGYPSAPERLELRLARLLAAEDQALFVAEDGPELVGWAHVQEFLSLVSDPCALLTGLVVAAPARRRGVGRALVGEAEAWARARGLSAMRLRARVARHEAHAFYRELGYAEVKRQVQFKREL